MSTIFFRDIPQATIDTLLDEGDVFHSAGALLVEHPLMQACVERIDGSLEGVLGLSEELLNQLLDEILN